ncbi:KH_1 domain-containing protein [Cephalotus follicularis]|uniref:KH_1 domain-containing protein n=1 Tax=Cephalotus follicularis TaxID=3775 RepID=A0A1Q3AU57_CEPFO|nr:KH_1 domain-containing protein [Cephalotus follicularis]
MLVSCWQQKTVMVSAKEELDASISPAMDGLLRVHGQIVGLDNDPQHASSGVAGIVTTKLLVADTHAKSLIGKQGSTIKSILDSSNCFVGVLGTEHLPLFALQADRVVKIQGEPASVHKAVELIANHLRKFLVDRSIVSVFENQMQMPNVRVNLSMPPPQTWCLPPQGFPANAGGGPGFRRNPQYMQPTRQLDRYNSPSARPLLDQHSHQSLHGMEASVGGHSQNVKPQELGLKKIIHHVLIPLSSACVGAVIGPSGANLSYIRRPSGADIAIHETGGMPGQLTVELNGSASQMHTAAQLILNFMAEAASLVKNPTGGSVCQGYSACLPHGPGHGSPP